MEIKIKQDNSAFDNDHYQEEIRILKNIMYKLENETKNLEIENEFVLKDLNGNKIGKLIY